MVEHRALTATLAGAQERLCLRANDALPNLASFAFDISLLELLVPLIAGGRAQLLGSHVLKDLDALVEHTRTATVLHAVPSLMEAWRERLGSRGPQSYPQLRTLLVGGEAVPARLLERLAAQFPGVDLIELYGPTEATIISTSCDVLDNPTQPSIGRPLANTRTYVLDEHGQPVPLGAVGEIHIGGAGVARGYLNRPEPTAERFIDSPFVAGDRLYKTGDLARYRSDGNLELLGRNDQQVKLRGYRIELGEIEARLAEHPAVREAVVLAREDSPGDRRLVAYLVYADDAATDDRAAELRAHLAARLPEHMVPAAYVRLEALPLTPNGKLDRKALPAPEDTAYARHAFEPPEGEIEQTLARLWSELLSVERISRHDHFFELGGHSLLAIRLLERLRRLGLSAAVRDLFTAPVLAEFAATLGRRSEVVVPPNVITLDSSRLTPAMLPLIDLTQEDVDRIVAATPGGLANIQDVYALSPLQEGLLFHHLLADDGDPYLLTGVVAFRDRAQLDRHLAAFQHVVDRHDILRTAFHWQGLSAPAQVVHRRAVLSVTELTLDPADGPAAEQLEQRFDPLRYRLDLAEPPLLRFVVAFDTAQQRWLLLQLQHHLIGDHSALEMLHDEVRAILEGRG